MRRGVLIGCFAAALLAGCEFSIPANTVPTDWGVSSVTLRDANTGRTLDERCRLSSLGPPRDYFLTLKSGGSTAVQLSIEDGCVNPIPVKLREAAVTVSSVVVSWDSCAAVSPDAPIDLAPLAPGVTKFVDVELREKGGAGCSQSY